MTHSGPPVPPRAADWPVHDADVRLPVADRKVSLAPLRREISAGLFGDHVCRIPVRPVRVGLAGALLMPAMGGGRPPKGAREVACGAERRLGWIDAAGEASRDLLEHPAVAVGIGKRGERTVGVAIRGGSIDSAAHYLLRRVPAEVSGVA